MSAFVAQADAVLRDQIGVALLVLLQLCDNLFARQLHRGQAVLLVELLVAVGGEGGLHALDEPVLDLLGGALRDGHEAVLRDLDVEALLFGGGHLGQVLDAVGAEDREGGQLAGLDVLDRLTDLDAGHVDLVAEHRGQGRCAPVERHRLRVDIAGLEQQRGGQLCAGADAGGPVADDAGGVLDVVEIAVAAGRVGHQDVVVAGDTLHDVEVVEVGHLVRCDGHRGDREQRGVLDRDRGAVRRGVGDLGGRQRAVGALAVDDGEGGAEVVGQALGHRTADEVAGAAGGGADVHLDGPGRVLAAATSSGGTLDPAASGQDQARRSCRGEPGAESWAVQDG